MWRLQGSGAIFVCWVSVKLRLLFTAGPYWQVVSARCAVWIFIDLWNLRPQNACSLSFLRPALKICVKNADFCVNANPAQNAGVLVVLIGAGNALSPVQCQTITWAIADVVDWTLGYEQTSLKFIYITKVCKFSFTKKHLKMVAILFRPRCL